MEFRVCIDNPFLNCKKVHPYGQRKMRYILDNVDLSGEMCIRDRPRISGLEHTIPLTVQCAWLNEPE